MAKGINWGPDLGAPVVVTAIDLVLESTAPTYTKWATGIMAVGGYIGNYADWGGDFIKNVGIAALPAFGKNIYDYVKGGMSAAPKSNALAFRSRVSAYPSPAGSAPFGAVRLT